MNSALIAVRDLESAAKKIGVTLEIIHSDESRVDDGHLYIWVDRTSAENVLYIGKASSARRLANEMDWRRLPPNFSLSARDRPIIASPIVSLLRRNSRPEPRRYRVGQIDWTRVDAAVGAAADRVLAKPVVLDEPFISEWASESVAPELKAKTALVRWISQDFATWRNRYQGDERPSDSDIEALLVRIVVRSGAVLANAQYAGQWESLTYRAYDTIALLAVQESIPAETFQLDLTLSGEV